MRRSSRRAIWPISSCPCFSGFAFSPGSGSCSAAEALSTPPTEPVAVLLVPDVNQLSGKVGDLAEDFFDPCGVLRHLPPADSPSVHRADPVQGSRMAELLPSSIGALCCLIVDSRI